MSTVSLACCPECALPGTWPLSHQRMQLLPFHGGCQGESLHEGTSKEEAAAQLPADSNLNTVCVYALSTEGGTCPAGPAPGLPLPGALAPSSPTRPLGQHPVWPPVRTACSSGEGNGMEEAEDQNCKVDTSGCPCPMQCVPTRACLCRLSKAYII